MSLQIKHAPSPNHGKGRGGRRPIAIVNHITAGAFPGCLNWLQNPVSKASSHILITRGGSIYRLVADEDTAWANGAVNRPSWRLYDGTNPNRYTLSIEHEGYRTSGGDGALTGAQFDATVAVHRYWIQRHGIPINRDHIIGHYQIDSVNRPNCPGPAFPWSRLMGALQKGESPVSLEQWMITEGMAAIRELAKKGILNNPERWSSPEELAKPMPQYLAFILLNRIEEGKK